MTCSLGQAMGYKDLQWVGKIWAVGINVVLSLSDGTRSIGWEKPTYVVMVNKELMTPSRCSPSFGVKQNMRSLQGKQKVGASEVGGKTGAWSMVGGKR